MAAEGGGYWSVHDERGREGDRYRFSLEDGTPIPDPGSRFQPDGVHEASACVDPRRFAWQAREWRRPGWHGQVIYELHVGTFTDQGTFRSAIERLDHVRALGAQAIELMPLADFPGARNWGYDGVALYAPARCYGTPDDLRALVDAAHLRGLAVILDVVYNHFGPVGNYLPQISSRYFHQDNHTPWGAALNLDGENSAGVRGFLLGNATYWLDEFRFDGLRVDATHAIVDRSPKHFLAELSELVHARGAFLIAEDDRNTLKILGTAGNGGAHFDAAWADDFHHQVRVALTGNRESYFGSYSGTTHDLADTLAHGWFYRGQPYPFWKGRPKGEPSEHLAPSAFVVCIENHDQVGNRAAGERLAHLVTAQQYRAAVLLLCLSPYAPLIFMGQEWSSGSPFLFFTDHAGEVGRQVSAGRKKEFAASGLNAGVSEVPDPQEEQTFVRSKLDWPRALGAGASVLELYRAALEERRLHLTEANLRRERWKVSGENGMLVLRYALPEGDRALIAVFNSDSSHTLPPLLATAANQEWRVVLDSVAETAEPGKGSNLQLPFPGPRAVWVQLQPKP